MKGYNGTGFKCTDIIEWVVGELNSCHIDADYPNKNGSFECSCKKGYDGDGTQFQDTDECSAVARCMIVIRMLIASTLKSYGTATVRKALMAMERTVLVRVVLLKGTFA